MNTTKGETMYSSKMLMWVVSAAYLLPATLQAATYLLVPPYAIEQSSLSNDPLDDSVEVYSGPQDPQPLYPGDKVIWDYEYRTSYEVLSPDLADINELRVYGPALAGNPTVNVSLQLTDPQHNFIDPGYKFDSIAWGTDSVLVSDADDVLGNLSGLAIGGFHLEITMVSGSAGFGGARFNWGASDIAVVPEASTLMLLGLGAGLLGVCYRHRS